MNDKEKDEMLELPKRIAEAFNHSEDAKFSPLYFKIQNIVSEYIEQKKRENPSW